MFSKIPAHARLKKSLPQQYQNQIQIGKQKTNVNKMSQQEFVEQVDRLLKESEEMVSKGDPQKKKKIIEDEEDLSDHINTVNCQRALNRAIQDDDENQQGPLINSSSDELRGVFIRNKQVSHKLEESQKSSQKISKRLKKKMDCELQVAQDDPSLCPICLNNFKDQDVAVISCKHIFCFECIKAQGEQYSNKCPLCRKSFTYLKRGKQMADGDFQKIDSVLLKLKKEEESESEEYENSFINDGELEYYSDDNESVYEDCEICGCGEDLAELLTCTMCHKRKSHSYCLLECGQNEEDWGCSVCYY